MLAVLWRKEILFFFLTILLRYNLRSKKFTHLKYMDQWFFSTHIELCNHDHNLNLDHFITSKDTPCPFSVISHIPSHPTPPQTQATINLLYISVDLPTLGIPYMESYNMWSSVTDFFYLTQCFQSSPIL